MIIESKQKAKSDFRYATGEAKVPWAVIGENMNVKAVMELRKLK